MAEDNASYEEGSLEEEVINKSEKRFKDLSEKVRLTAEERDEKERLLKEKEEALAQKEKEVEFFKNFSQITSKYTGAGEYQDKIHEKYMAGYDVEDAAIAILAKEGKYTPEIKAEPKESPAGGSAPNTMTGGAVDKPLSEMQADEKREALLKLEQESGGLSALLGR